MNTPYFLNLALDTLFDQRDIWIGLTANVPADGSITAEEPSGSGTGYARVKLTGLSPAAGGVKTNSADLSFPESLGTWGAEPMRSYLAFDAAEPGSGNLLFFGRLKNSSGADCERYVEGEMVQLTIPAGSIQLELTDGN